MQHMSNQSWSDSLRSDISIMGTSTQKIATYLPVLLLICSISTIRSDEVCQDSRIYLNYRHHFGILLLAIYAVVPTILPDILSFRRLILFKPNNVRIHIVLLSLPSMHDYINLNPVYRTFLAGSIFEWGISISPKLHLTCS